MKSKLLLLFLFFGTLSIGAFSQSNIRQRHNGEASWNSFLDKNMVSVTEAPEKAGASPVLITGGTDKSIPSAANLSHASFIVPDAVETKSYRWFDSNYVVTVYSVKRLETLYKREMANQKAKK